MNEVAKNILIKGGLLPGNSSPSKIGLLCTGGAQAGTFNAGVLYHMHCMGLHDKFDVVVATSASAPNCAFFLSGSGPKGLPTYWVENCHGLINPWRFWKMVDLQKVEKAVRETRPLDFLGVLHNPTKFYVTLTDTQGNGELLDVKSEKDIVAPVIASCGLPFFWNRPRKIRSKSYLDGNIALPLPIKEVIEKFGLTDLLVVLNEPNKPFNEKVPWFEKAAARVFLQPFSKNLEKAYLENYKNYNEGLNYANTSNNTCRIAVISPSYAIDKSCTDKEILKKFIEEGIKQAGDFFGT